MDILAAWGGIRPYRDLLLPGLVDEAVADLKLHRQDSACGGLRRLAFLLGPWLSHPCYPPAASPWRATAMDAQALRLLIREKLQDGRLPRDSSLRARGSPGDGATCDACGAIITADQVMMEVGPLTGEKRSLCFHADCFQLWNAERHTKQS